MVWELLVWIVGPTGRWYERERGDYNEARLHFSTSESIELFEYMEGPLPNFEYRFPKGLR